MSLRLDAVGAFLALIASPLMAYGSPQTSEPAPPCEAHADTMLVQPATIASRGALPRWELRSTSTARWSSWRRDPARQPGAVAGDPDNGPACRGPELGTSGVDTSQISPSSNPVPAQPGAPWWERTAPAAPTNAANWWERNNGDGQSGQW